MGHGVTGPRLFVIPARDAPVAAVLRRGPSDWAHVGRWLIDEPAYESGAWFRATIYPQKCDLSPDGRWLAYSTLNERSPSWAAGSIYEAVSRLPWLHALAAWEAGTTYTRGIHFDDEAGVCALGEPDEGDARPLLKRYGIKITPATQFAVERRRGWVESASTPPPDEGGPFDELRRVVMEKRRPGTTDGPTLAVEGSWAAFRSVPEYRDPACYWLETVDRLEVLEGVQWADWSHDGRLLVATSGGALEVRLVDDVRTEVVWAHDLAGLTPDPGPAPAWARQP